MTAEKIKGGPSRVKAVSAWGEFCLALKEDGTVYSWGANTKGRAGQPSSTVNSGKPTKVAQLRNIVAISAGYWHSLALDSRGKIFSTGNNKNGELGRDGNGEEYEFVEVPSPEGVVFTSIAAGFSVSFAIDQNGQLYSFG